MRPLLVSVIMPVFNPGIFLRPAVESVLAQECIDWELVVVDDGSTDGSRDRLRTWCDPRIRVLENPRNLGPAVTRNRALAEARGEFIAFLNHDDVAVPGRLARQVAHLRAHPDVHLLGGALHVHETGPCRDSFWRGPATELGIRWHGLLDCPMRISTVMIRREALERHDLHFDAAWPIHADYVWVMQAVRAVRAQNLAEPLATAYRHPDCLSLRQAPALAEAAARIALAAIRAELPDFSIDLPTVARLRTVVGGASGESRSLALASRMLDVYLDLFDAFCAKYRGYPDLARLNANLPATTSVSR